jgi:hypothetical protein
MHDHLKEQLKGITIGNERIKKTAYYTVAGRSKPSEIKSLKEKINPTKDAQGDESSLKKEESVHREDEQKQLRKKERTVGRGQQEDTFLNFRPSKILTSMHRYVRTKDVATSLKNLVKGYIPRNTVKLLQCRTCLTVQRIKVRME